MSRAATAVEQEVKCRHCNLPCGEEPLWFDDEPFCCAGCKMVYEILKENDLCRYYHLSDAPGKKEEVVDQARYAGLDQPEIRKQLVDFDSPELTRVLFSVPAIHCVSCIWLLENLHRLCEPVLRSEVNFARKTVTIDFDPSRGSLTRVAQTLASIGYPPTINLKAGEGTRVIKKDQLVYQLAIAGFCFGNIMLYSFPEYFGIERLGTLRGIFFWLNAALAIPVVFYSARDYFISAWNSLLQRRINIDVPLALGIGSLFLRSAWEILSGYGPGYFDSLSGLVFFLLIGRWFQAKTYQSLAFDRDYRSYFPLAVLRWRDGDWKSAIVHDLQEGDTLRIRNNEIVPADAIMKSEEAWFDYSFVTGESRPVKVLVDGTVYAGGRVIGKPVDLVVVKKSSQSYLTSLWNDQSHKKENEGRYKLWIDRAAYYFTFVVLVVALATGVVWYLRDPSRAWLVFTSVLIVACPCALALSGPFTFGGMMRVFGRHGFYLKNAGVVERLATVNQVIFDKTGTITHGSRPKIDFSGILTRSLRAKIAAVVQTSAHPLSVAIAQFLAVPDPMSPSDVREFAGKGIQARLGDDIFKVGSASFAGCKEETIVRNTTTVYVTVNDEVVGSFHIENMIRSGLSTMIKRLHGKEVAVLSGDHGADRQLLRDALGPETPMFFGQSPYEKADFIRILQEKGRTVMMVGDGLNDAGALRECSVGVAVTDHTGFFTPATDAILLGSQLPLLDRFLSLSKTATRILVASFMLSFGYNVVGMTFAVSGMLTPLVAAILMPLSSISVVALATLSVSAVTLSLRSKQKAL